ncbi:hypothetical protein ZWY2020_003203 [Hordeum vulgare]|nr:hypothetical protein ZWY2020_003203 [Hordeum vulgare]
MASDVRMPSGWHLSVDGVPVAPVPEAGTHLFARAVGLYRAQLSAEELQNPLYAPNNPAWPDTLADQRRFHAAVRAPQKAQLRSTSPTGTASRGGRRQDRTQRRRFHSILSTPTFAFRLPQRLPGRSQARHFGEYRQLWCGGDPNDMPRL